MSKISQNGEIVRRTTVNLSDNDEKNAKYLGKRLGARNTSQAISAALAISVTLGKLIEEGELLLRQKDGSIERLRFTGLE